MKMLTNANAIPPNDGMAIGIMMSEPRPVEVNTGSSAIMVVLTVINAGLILLKPASTTASFTSWVDWGALRLKL